MKGFQTGKYNDSLVYILIKAFQNWEDAGRKTLKSAMMEASYIEWIADDSSIKGVFFKGFELTRNIEDIVSASEINKYLKQNGIKDSTAKIGKEITKIGRFNDENKKNHRLDGGASALCYFGVRRILTL